METSILTGTKKILGLAEDYTAFDHDIITHINSVFFTLTQLGVGPITGFMIEDETAQWNDFFGATETDDPALNAIRTYVYLRVRLLFDPPQISYLLDAMQRQIQEIEWRLNVNREETQWVDPDPTASQSDELQELIDTLAGQVID